MKYSPVYKVTLNSTELGYVTDKKEFEDAINDIIYGSEKNIAFLIEENLPEFELVLNSEYVESNNDSILSQISNIPLVAYRTYAIVLNDEETQYVNTLEEANEIVEDIKKDISDEVKLTLGIRELYTYNSEPEIATEMTVAKAYVEESVNEELRILGSTVNDVFLSKPVSGTITSRYGAISRIRSGAHTGLDIANATGTPIKAAAKGIVTSAEYSGAYGNLVIVEHDNGVETYYAHCSKIYVEVGDEVTPNTTIAAVGSTGNSTGPHLHFEIRVNGQTINPQKYLYK